MTPDAKRRAGKFAARAVAAAGKLAAGALAAARELAAGASAAVAASPLKHFQAPSPSASSTDSTTPPPPSTPDCAVPSLRPASSPPPSNTSAAGPAASPVPTPAVFGFNIKKRYKHDPKAFTQGLLWDEGSIYESLGLRGQSSVREVKLLPKEGDQEGGYKIIREAKLEDKYFGEGLCRVKDELLQLLWQTHDGFRFPVEGDWKDWKPLKEPRGLFQTPEEMTDAWGLASDGKTVLATDGSPNLLRLDSETLAFESQVTIRDDKQDVAMVNELELIHGELWGNVYGKDCIVRVDPSTGQVRGWVDLSDLSKEVKADPKHNPGVLNGIAWDPQGKQLFVTGKNWPFMYDIEVIPHPTLTLDDARKLCIPEGGNVFGPMPKSS